MKNSTKAKARDLKRESKPLIFTGDIQNQKIMPSENNDFENHPVQINEQALNWLTE